MPRAWTTTSQKGDRTLRSFIAESGHTKGYLAKRLGMSCPTFYGRLESPEKMTLAELRTLCTICDIPADAVADIVGVGRRVAK